MKRYPVLVVLLTAVAAMAKSGGQEEGNAEPPFPFYGEVGKEVDLDYLRKYDDLGSFLDTLDQPGAMTLAERFEKTWPRPYKSHTVQSFGKWHQWDAFLLTVHGTGATWPDGSVFVLVLREADGRMRPLVYREAGWDEDTAVLQGVIDVSGQPVLSLVRRVPGTGGLRDEFYFLYDMNAKRPMRLNLEPIESRLTEVLDERLGVTEGGGFDIRDLSYRQYVRREGQGAAEIAGAVFIQFELRDNALVPVRTVYDPAITYEQGLAGLGK